MVFYHCDDVNDTPKNEEEMMKILGGLIVYGSNSLLSLADIDEKYLPVLVSETQYDVIKEDSASYFEGLAYIRRVFNQETRSKMFSYKEYCKLIVEGEAYFTNRTSCTYHTLYQREVMLQLQWSLVDLSMEFMERFHGFRLIEKTTVKPVNM